MVLSFIIYAQVFLCTALYAVCVAPFFLFGILFLTGFKKGNVAKVARFFILWYGKFVIYVALKPYVWVRFENLSEEKSVAGIYIFNHRSSSDPFLVSAVTDLPVAQVVNDWPMKLFFFGFFARIGEYIDIKSMPFEEALAKARYLIGKNVPLMVFPEGTRSGGHHMNPFHGAFFRIAKELNCPLIPVAIAGNERIPTRSFKMHCGRILIHRLPAIPPETVQRLKPYPLKNHVHRVLYEETVRMDRKLGHEQQ